MSDKKNIDRLFQEKFKDFEVAPDDAVWENIQDALHKDEPKRRVVPFWWKLSGVAAALVLFFTIGNALFNRTADFNSPNFKVGDTETTRSSPNPFNNNNNTSSEDDASNLNNITNNNSFEESNDNSENDIYKEIISQQNKATNKIAREQTAEQTLKRNSSKSSNSKHNEPITTPKKSAIKSSKEEIVAQNSLNKSPLKSNKEVINQSQQNDKKLAVSHDNHEKTTQNALNQPQLNTNNALKNQNQQSDKSIATIDTKQERATQPNVSDVALEEPQDDVITTSKKDVSIEDAIAEAKPIVEEEKESKSNKWNITPNVAPVYFNSFGKGSTIDNQFVNNSKSGEVNMSYGLHGSYAINDKIKIRAGINKVNLGYSTDNVIAFQDVNSFNSNSKRERIENISFNARGVADSYMSTSNINTTSAPQFVVSNMEGSLEQQFGYIEVPLEVEYNLINQKFGLNVIGGFSTLFLNNNEIFSVSPDERFLLGEANNINNTSYSANLGLGINYNISQHLRLNLEPMFKYQINTFSNISGDFKPYFIGVYTGVSFKF